MADQTNPLDLRPAPPAAGCWYLTGPTASGKTKVGIELALRLNAEIVSLDSMTIYRGMDIGTAKPSAEDRSRVPHHLLDLLPPSEDFSLSEYIDAAHAAIAEIKSRGKEVLFVGGTPLYLKSLLRGVYQGPPADWEFRAAIDRELKSLPIEALHDRLQVIDPLLAAKLHPNDKRRIIRGLEVFKLTGQRLSHLQTQFDEGRPASQVKVFVLSWPREELHRRIDTRVEQMFAAGLIDEVRDLLEKHGSLSRTALQAVGYREVIELLASGRRAPPEANCIARVKARTRQFARRQETWFRSLSECTPVPMHEPIDAAAVAESIASQGLPKPVVHPA
jgi:tRNA dimethylallyltransferase